MFNLIDKLRRKTESEKRAIALTVSVSITAIIFLIWLSTFWIKPVANESSNDKSISAVITPLITIKKNIVDLFSNFTQVIGGNRNSSQKNE